MEKTEKQAFHKINIFIPDTGFLTSGMQEYIAQKERFRFSLFFLLFTRYAHRATRLLDGITGLWFCLKSGINGKAIRHLSMYSLSRVRWRNQ